MDKHAAADYLGMPLRTFQRFVSAKGYRPRYVNKKADYPEDVIRAWKAEREAEEMTVTPAPAPSVPAPLARSGTGGALAREAPPGLLALFERVASGLNSSAPTAPSVWLTIDAAAEWLGLPRAHVAEALKADRQSAARRIREHGRGRGLRVHCDDLRAYFENG